MLRRRSKREKSTKYVNNRTKLSEQRWRGQQNQKGPFNACVNAILDCFFEKIEITGCEIPWDHECWSDVHYSHSEKRRYIPVGEWSNALEKVIKACDVQHGLYEAAGHKVNRDTVNRIRRARNERLGLTDQMIRELLLECAAEVLKRDALEKEPKWQQFEVEFPVPEAPFEIELEDSVWTVEENSLA